MNFLYKDFLENQSTYLKNELYYKNLFTEIAGKKPIEYYNTTFKNGKKFFDGNPIFNTKFNNRLVRIIQDEPESEKPYFKARVETKENAVDELVINLELSKEIEPILVFYLKKWFKEEISVDQIQQLNKNYISENDTLLEEVREPESTYQRKKESKFSSLISLYTKELKDKVGITPDADLLKAVTKACGPAIYNKDSSKISVSDPEELARVKKNFLIRKLGLPDNPLLNKAIKEVADLLGSSNKHKYRAIFYYLLVKKFNKDSIFLK